MTPKPDTDDMRVLADGEHGAPGHGPFDRIIVAARCWNSS